MYTGLPSPEETNVKTNKSNDLNYFVNLSPFLTTSIILAFIFGILSRFSIIFYILTFIAVFFSIVFCCSMQAKAKVPEVLLCIFGGCVAIILLFGLFILATHPFIDWQSVLPMFNSVHDSYSQWGLNLFLSCVGGCLFFGLLAFISAEFCEEDK